MDAMLSSVTRCRAALASLADATATLFDEPGVTFVAEDGRAGTRVVSAYCVGEHTMLRCDPAVVDRCRSLLRQETLDLDGFEAALAPFAETMHGRGLIHVLEGTSSLQPAGTLAEVASLAPTDPTDRAAIAELVDRDPEGADEAEIELDDLDGRIVGVRDGDALVAYASEQPWDLDPVFADIGVMTAPGHRGRGLGHVVVEQLARQVDTVGRVPMYRCDQENVASKALCDRVGFTQVCTLAAITLAQD